MRNRRNAIGESFVAHTREMRESVAWRHLSNNARRVLDRLELEHMRHGAADNGSLPCTYRDFIKSGIRRASIAPSIRQCVALGFLEVTHAGGRSISNLRWPSRYRLTYLNGCGRSPAPTHEWRRIDTEAEALGAVIVADGQKNYAGQPSKTKSSKIKKPDTKTEPSRIRKRNRNEGCAGSEYGTPVPVPNTELLSISRVGRLQPDNEVVRFEPRRGVRS